MNGAWASQVVTVSWLTATVFFLVTYLSPCVPLPPKDQLLYFEAGSGEDQDFYAGISGADNRGLRHFPQLWCALLQTHAAPLSSSGDTPSSYSMTETSMSMSVFANCWNLVMYCIQYC